MLDTEPTGGSTADQTRGTAATPTGADTSGPSAAASGPDDTAGTPAKKAARKAPAKRAPRKAAAKKAAPAVDPAAANPDGAPETAAQPVLTPALPDIVAAPLTTPAAAAAPDQPAGDPTAAAAPAKKATRARKAPAKKVPAKKAAAGAEPDAASPQPADAAPSPAVEPLPSPAAEAAGPADPSPSTDQAQSADPAPAKKAPRKRVSKAAKAAAEQAADQPPADQSTGPTSEPATAAGPSAAPVLSAPVVLFQPPAAEPAPRRRRGAKKAAGSPAVQPEPRPAEEVPDFTDLEPDDLDTDLEPEDIDDLDTSDDDAESPDADESADEADTGEEPDAGDGPRRRRRRGRRGRGNRSSTAEAADAGAGAEDSDDDEDEEDHADEVAEAALSASARRRRRRRRSSSADGTDAGPSEDDPPNTVVHVRESRSSGRGSAADDDGVRGVKGSTRLEAKRQRRRDNRDTGRRRAPILTEAEFLARREAVDRVMAVRQTGDRTQIAVLEDDILVEHYVTRASASSAVGNVYLGRVQNVLPSMEAAFVDIGRGRNGVLYAGEVNWDSAGLAGKSRSIENALSGGDLVMVQVTKDPIGHKGARLTSQISLPGRFVVYVPGGGMTGISRKLPDVERSRLKAILKKVVPDEAGVIVRTAAEGASEQDLINDVERLKSEWESISAKADRAKKSSDGPLLLHGEPDLAIRVVRDIFNDDFAKLVVAGAEIHRTLSDYVGDIAPDLADRISRHTAESDLFRDLRVDEQLAKAMDRKVWLPSGGSLVIDRTEAMTVVDVNTGKYTGSGGNLEQTVTRNNLEAAEEIVRQLRLRDIGGIVVIDFIDMVLESNRELVLRRLTECLGRDRTKHQVAEVTSLGLVQMTRKRVGEGLLEAFSEPCSVCNGRGLIVHLDGVDKKSNGGGGGSTGASEEERPTRSRRSRKAKAEPQAAAQPDPAELAAEAEKRRAAASAVAAIAAATSHHDVAGSRAGGPSTGQDHNGTEPGSARPAAEPSAGRCRVLPGRVLPSRASRTVRHRAPRGRLLPRRRALPSRAAPDGAPGHGPASAAGPDRRPRRPVPPSRKARLSRVLPSELPRL